MEVEEKEKSNDFKLKFIWTCNNILFNGFINFTLQE